MPFLNQYHNILGIIKVVLWDQSFKDQHQPFLEKNCEILVRNLTTKMIQTSIVINGKLNVKSFGEASEVHSW